MENGYDRKFAEKFSGLAISGAGDRGANNDSSLFQVMKAVEAAEATIKQQVEENIRLRTELQNKILELDRYKVEESGTQRMRSGDPWSERVQGSYEAHQPVPPNGSQEDRIRSAVNSSRHDPSGTLVLHQESLKPNADAPAQNNAETHSSSNKINGSMKEIPQQSGDNAGFSQLSSPSTTSVSPGRFNTQGEYDQRFNFSGQGVMPITELNPRSLWKQDLIVKTHEHEEEIMQLRRHLSDYSIKEAQIRNEKYVLEKRIAYMRLAFDQQQQDLVDAASKALSYRQDIIEENIRLTYALQDAQQERSTFVSSLLPLLAEYSLQPPVLDAQSIVSNVKVLFKHLQEKLLLTETKLKESQYHLRPWNSELNNSNIAMQSPSPSHSFGAALTTSNKNGLELVPQQTYSHGQVPVSSSDVQTTRDWDLLGRGQSALDGVVNRNVEPNDLGRYSPFASRNSAAQDTPTQLDVTRGDAPISRYGEETTSKQVTFRDPVRNTELDDQDPEGNQVEREMSTNWSPGNTPYTTPDDPGSSYHFLPPVLEEPSSSFSEAADDDPLPAIENLQISGEAFPGRELQACGYSINGTTSCNFEWVRHMEDGSVNYIEGAKQPNYLITADDVDTYLAIEVQPLDNRKRKGELVKVFANENRKIPLDPEMQAEIQKILYQGHSSFKIYQSTGYLDIWEPAILAIKKDSYSIKCTGPSGTVITEKFSPTITVGIPYGSPTEFVLTDSAGVHHLLKTDNDPQDYSCSRDTVVVTLRMFINRAGERKKRKKRGIIF